MYCGDFMNLIISINFFVTLSGVMLPILVRLILRDFLLVVHVLYTQIDSMLPCVCSVMDHR